jgi:hypothetical protein
VVDSGGSPRHPVAAALIAVAFAHLAL